MKNFQRKTFWTGQDFNRRSLKTFWATTGMFPQEFVIKFSSPVSVKKIIISSTKGYFINIVSEWLVEGATETKFEPIAEQG